MKLEKEKSYKDRKKLLSSSELSALDPGGGAYADCGGGEKGGRGGGACEDWGGPCEAWGGGCEDCWGAE
jgi:hypothetical protein